MPATRTLPLLETLCLSGFIALFGLVNSSLGSPLQWQQSNGFRRAELAVPSSGKAGFSSLPSSITGITFTNLLSEARHLPNQVLLNGSGVAAGDVDSDGWCDLYFCALDGPNVLYRNLGNWKFEDITASAGVAMPNTDSTGAAFADIDGDGDLDLIVNTMRDGTHIFINDGKGHFKLLSRVNLGKGATSLALADIDGDGFLDLYVANYRSDALMDMPNTRFWLKNIGGKQVVSTVNGRPVTEPDLADRYVVSATGGIIELGEADVLFHNDHGTNFVPVSWTDGSFLDEDGHPLQRPPFDWGLSVAFRDLNGDGRPDIYVCNDFDTPDRIWINQGGKFRAIPRLAIRKTSLFSMGVDFADINRDGYDDIFVLDMLSRDHLHRMMQLGDRSPPVPVIGKFDTRPQYLMNTLLLSRGDGTYTEAAQLAGINASEWSWAAIFLDVDLDGWEDLLISNGNERDGRNIDVTEELRRRRTERERTRDEIIQARKLFPRLATPNLAFRNQHDLTFKDVSQQWGFQIPTVSHGMALADLDNDGDLDLVINNLNGPAGIYRNDATAPRVAIRLRGAGANTRGIGAAFKVTGGPISQSQQMMCGGRYLSSDDPMRVFAAGTNLLNLEVTWPTGRKSVIPSAQPNCIYEIQEPVSEPVRTRIPFEQQTNQTWFEDKSTTLRHSHHEESFDDFARQGTLEIKMSQEGPGVCWADLDGDGWDDLIITSGKGGTPGVFRNNHNGGFVAMQGKEFATPATVDQLGIVSWPGSGAGPALLVAMSPYENDPPSPNSIWRYAANGSKLEDLQLSLDGSGGPLAMADIDGDGDLDLFVGGRSVPGKYPAHASSLILRNVNGEFEIDAQNAKILNHIGLVKSAVFSDLDGDGFPELILACEWGPIRVLHNEGGLYKDATGSLGLLKFTGWWNGVTTADLDGDGKVDIIASNWGRNIPYESHRSQPLRLYFGDIDDVGKVDLLYSYFEPAAQKYVPERMLGFVSRSIRMASEKWTTTEGYGRSSIDDFLGNRLSVMNWHEAAWLESTVFFNRGGRFEARPLPTEAQLTPGLAVCSADFDGDGNEDLFLSQNFFALQPDFPRGDGGRGLLLLGDGKGNLAAVPGQLSGIRVYGEQRGAAVCDYDHDGRLDLAVTQNGADTKLYRNQHSSPCLRVRLTGPPANPQGIGALLQAHDGQRWGPLREIHAGSGYLSQDSAVQLFGPQASIRKIRVQWPGQKNFKESDVPNGLAEIVVDTTGAVQSSSR